MAKKRTVKKAPSKKQLANWKRFAEMSRKRAAAKKKAAKKKKTWQTGSSETTRDKQRKAKTPGKRKAASGKTYIERRVNRSDMPGKLTGLGAISLNEIGAELYELEAKITNLKEKKRQAKTKKDKAEIQYAITILSNQFKALRAYLNTKAKFVKRAPRWQ